MNCSRFDGASDRGGGCVAVVVVLVIVVVIVSVIVVVPAIVVVVPVIVVVVPWPKTVFRHQSLLC